MKNLTRHVLLQLAETVDDGLAVVDVSDAGWRIDWFNDAFAAITAREAGALASQSARELVQRLGGSVAVSQLTEAMAAGERLRRTLKSPTPEKDTPALVLRAQPVLQKNGTRSSQYLLVLKPRAATESLSETAELRSELAAAHAQIDAMSDDSVTGLASERRFRSQLERDWSIAQREAYPLSLIGLAMDAFNAYRDTFGDHATDSCLRMLARTVRRRLRRGSDFAGFFPPSTIMLLISGGEQDAVQAFADRIAADVAALHIHHPHSPVARHVTMSVAVASAVPADGGTIESFLESALPAPSDDSAVIEFSRLADDD